MLGDPEIDYVYIASPNSLHFLQAKQALAAGKNVLCEKPFTSTLAEAEILAEMADAGKLFIFEMITTMYLPNYELVRRHLPDIGDVRLVQCAYCQYSGKYDALRNGELPNVFNPEFSGGSFMDINLYNIYFVMGLFGAPERAKYYPNLHAGGIDTSGILIMEYPGFVCECTGAKDTWGVNGVQIQGNEGFILVPDAANSCREVRVVTKKEDRTCSIQEDTDRRTLEIRAVAEIIAAGDYGECRRRMKKTLEVVRFLEETRKDAGILFAADEGLYAVVN